MDMATNHQVDPTIPQPMDRKTQYEGHLPPGRFIVIDHTFRNGPRDGLRYYPGYRMYPLEDPRTGERLQEIPIEFGDATITAKAIRQQHRPPKTSTHGALCYQLGRTKIRSREANGSRLISPHKTTTYRS